MCAVCVCNHQTDSEETRAEGRQIEWRMRGGGERDRVWDDQAGDTLAGMRRGVYMGMDPAAVSVCGGVCLSLCERCERDIK